MTPQPPRSTRTNTLFPTTTLFPSQNTQAVSVIFPIPPDFVAAQIDTLFGDVRIDAVKIGMLGQQTIIRTVAERLAHWKPQYLIVAPVMVAKSGDRCGRADRKSVV